MADEFVKMAKDGETIEVHPLVVEEHKRLGWKVVEEEASQVSEEPAEEPVAPKKSRKK